MIKIIEKGQKTFIRTCDRCGCKFQYDLSDLSGSDYISCPYCHTTLIHIGPHAKKVGPNDTDLSKTTKIDEKDKSSGNFNTGKINIDDIRKHTTTAPYKVEVDNGGYNYMTTTGQYVNPNTVTTISDVNNPGSDGVTGKVDPNIKLYSGKLPDDIVDDPYNNVGSRLPDDIKDDCVFKSDSFNEWYEQWVEQNGKPTQIEVSE